MVIVDQITCASITTSVRCPSILLGSYFIDRLCHLVNQKLIDLMAVPYFMNTDMGPVRVSKSQARPIPARQRLKLHLVFHLSLSLSLSLSVRGDSNGRSSSASTFDRVHCSEDHFELRYIFLISFWDSTSPTGFIPCIPVSFEIVNRLLLLFVMKTKYHRTAEKASNHSLFIE